jgi:hypothetical protein
MSFFLWFSQGVCASSPLNVSAVCQEVIKRMDEQVARAMAKDEGFHAPTLKPGLAPLALDCNSRTRLVGHIVVIVPENADKTSWVLWQKPDLHVAPGDVETYNLPRSPTAFRFAVVRHVDFGARVLQVECPAVAQLVEASRRIQVAARR